MHTESLTCFVKMKNQLLHSDQIIGIFSMYAEINVVLFLSCSLKYFQLIVGSVSFSMELKFEFLLLYREDNQALNFWSINRV